MPGCDVYIVVNMGRVISEGILQAVTLKRKLRYKSEVCRKIVPDQKKKQVQRLKDMGDGCMLEELQHLLLHGQTEINPFFSSSPSFRDCWPYEV